MKRRDFLKTTTAIGGLMVLGTVLPAIAQGEPVKGGTLIWGHSETTQNLDMHQNSTASTARVLQNVHNTLVTPDANLEIAPMLAESFEVSADGLTYTFKLRPGVKFHDGSDMTSADVKYSFERAKNPETKAISSDAFAAVQTIETPDDLTVIVKMSEIYAPFLSRIAENGAGVIMPEGSGDKQGETPIGAGPFKFVSREFGNKVELARFDDYWNGPAYLDGIVAREVPEPTVRLTALRTGEVHLINDIPADRIEEIEGNADLQVVKWFPLNWDFINLNHDFAPFADPRVRQAFDHIIDKEALLQGALWGQGQVTASPSYPTSASYNKDLVQRPQDFEKALALLTEAGIKPGDLKITFKVTTNYPYHVEAAQILLEWFRAVGINMTIEQLTWADWLQQVAVQKNYQMTIANFFTLWESDYLYYRLWNSTGKFNYRNIKDPVLDELTEKGRRVVDPAERAQVYKAVQQQIFDEAHDILLWFRNGSIGAQKKVGGLDTVVHPNGSNLNFHKVWLGN